MHVARCFLSADAEICSVLRSSSIAAVWSPRKSHCKSPASLTLVWVVGTVRGVHRHNDGLGTMVAWRSILNFPQGVAVFARLAGSFGAQKRTLSYVSFTASVSFTENHGPRDCTLGRTRESSSELIVWNKCF